MDLDTLKGPDPFFFSTITPVDYKIPMVSIADIGATLAEQLASTEILPRKPYVVELHGPQMYSPLDVRAAFSKALGKEVELRPVEKDQLRQFYANVFPSSIVDYWTEMAESILPDGKLGAEYLLHSHAPIIHGHADLATAIEASFKEREVFL